MSIEQVIPWILTVFFGCCTLYFSLKTSRKAEKDEVKEDSANLTLVMSKLDTIRDDVKEIKTDNRSIQQELKEFRERLATNENSIKSFHRRLDEINAVIRSS